ncbi:hypothetical protein CP061683_0777, partial [Chlamydia psittaci 06-1683]
MFSIDSHRLLRYEDGVLVLVVISCCKACVRFLQMRVEPYM